MPAVVDDLKKALRVDYTSKTRTLKPRRIVLWPDKKRLAAAIAAEVKDQLENKEVAWGEILHLPIKVRLPGTKKKAAATLTIKLILEHLDGSG